PQPGGQTVYMSRPEFEVLYGGAAGPGKTWAIVVDALGLQYSKLRFGRNAIDHPLYRAVIFRRETTQLGKLIDEAKRLYPKYGGIYAGQRKGDPGAGFIFPSGAKIFFCHMQHEDDKENHQGIEYQFVGFDELTQFTITQYLYLFSRCRSTIPYLWPRVRSTTNPVGPGLMWVKKRFIKSSYGEFQPGKTYYFAPDHEHEPSENPTGIPVFDLTSPQYKRAKSRTFIPGFLYENKVLMKSDPGYMQNLMAMGRRYERALLYGDWDAFGGDFFDDFNRINMEVLPFDIPQTWSLVLSIDPGWSSACSAGLQARDHNSRIYRLFTYYVKNKAPWQHAAALKSRIENFPYTHGRWPDIVVAGHDAWSKKEKHASVASDVTFEDQFRDKGFVLQRAKTDRVMGWWAWKSYMRQVQNHEPMWQYFKHFNDPLIDEIISAQSDEDDPEDISGQGNDPAVFDHALDDSRYGIMALPMPLDWKSDKMEDVLYRKVQIKNRKRNRDQGSVMGV
ncbi:MAG: terminase family protein, partial [Candidatus Lokiarchaeota archaeon]